MRLRRRRTHVLSEAERARLDAVVNLARTEARGPEVRRVAKSLRQLREANHFVGQIEALIQGARS